MKDLLKGVLSGAAVLVVIVSAGAALDLGGRWYKSTTATFAGKADAERYIESGPVRIDAYNRFYDACAAIEGYEAAISAQTAALPGLTLEDASRTRAIITSITAQRSRAIAQYNADARKTDTLASFMASDLPYQIPDVKGGSTKCLAN